MRGRKVPEAEVNQGILNGSYLESRLSGIIDRLKWQP
jgi:hypothetical protein